jgi:hypothetical protein
VRETPPAPSIGRALRILRRLIPLLSLLPFVLAALPAPAQRNAPTPPAPAQQDAPDLFVTVFSEPGKDVVAVAYSDKAPAERIKQDFAEIARNLGAGPPRVKVTVSQGVPAAEATFTGLTDWTTGAVNLNPLIQAYKRYGRFQASFFFLGSFPTGTLENFDRPPLRVLAERNGNVINYRVSIDQSQGEPTTVPTVTSADTPDRKWIWGVAALSAVVAITVFLLVSVLLGQRRKQAAALPERAAGSPGSAAAPGSPPKGS